MKKIACALAFVAGLFVSFNSSVAQEVKAESSDAIFLEISGQRTFISLSYDRMLNDNFSVRAGVGFNSRFHGSKRLIPVFPLTMNYLHGRIHLLELSVGFSWWEGPLPIMLVGYRYQPAEGGISFRLAVNPFFSIRAGSSICSNDDYRDVQFGFGYSF